MPVDIQHHSGDPRELARIDHQRSGAAHQRLHHTTRVAVHPADHFAGAAAVVELQGEGGHVGKGVAAQPEGGAFLDGGLQVLVCELQQAGERGKEDDQRAEEGRLEARVVSYESLGPAADDQTERLVADHVVHDELEWPRRNDLERSHEHHHHHGQDQIMHVGQQVAVEACVEAGNLLHLAGSSPEGPCVDWADLSDTPSGATWSITC